MSDVRLFLPTPTNYTILDPHGECPSFEPVPFEQDRLRRITYANESICCETRNSELVLVTREDRRSILYDPFEGSVVCTLNPLASGPVRYGGAFPVIRGPESSIICYSPTRCFIKSMYMTRPGESDQKVNLTHPVGSLFLLCCSADQQGVTEDVLMGRELRSSLIYQVNLEKCRIVALPGRDNTCWNTIQADVCIHHNSIMVLDCSCVSNTYETRRLRFIDKRTGVAWFRYAGNQIVMHVKTDLYDQNQVYGVTESVDALQFFDIRKLDGLVSVDRVGFPQVPQPQTKVALKQIGPSHFAFCMCPGPIILTTRGKRFEWIEDPITDTDDDWPWTLAVSVKFGHFEELKIIGERIGFSLELDWPSMNIVLFGLVLRISIGFQFT